MWDPETFNHPHTPPLLLYQPWASHIPAQKLGLLKVAFFTPSIVHSIPARRVYIVYILHERGSLSPTLTTFSTHSTRAIALCNEHTEGGAEYSPTGARRTASGRVPARHSGIPNVSTHARLHTHVRLFSHLPHVYGRDGAAGASSGAAGVGHWGTERGEQGVTTEPERAQQ